MMGSDHHERNLSMSDAELIEQALSHPPLELPSKTSIDDAIRCAKLVKMRQGYSEKTGELAAWIERHPNEWRVLVSTFRDGLPALVAREDAQPAGDKSVGQIAYEGWAQGLPGCEWANQTATQKRAWEKAGQAVRTHLGPAPLWAAAAALTVARSQAERGADKAGCDGWRAQEMCRLIVPLIDQALAALQVFFGDKVK